MYNNWQSLPIYNFLIIAEWQRGMPGGCFLIIAEWQRGSLGRTKIKKIGEEVKW